MAEPECAESEHAESEHDAQGGPASSAKMFLAGLAAMVLIGGVVFYLRPLYDEVCYAVEPYLKDVKQCAADVGSIRNKHWWKDRTIYFNPSTLRLSTDEEVAEWKEWQEEMKECRERNDYVFGEGNW